MSLKKEDLKSSLFKYEIAFFPLFSHHLFHNIGHPSLPENSEEISIFSGWGKIRGYFANHARYISVKKLDTCKFKILDSWSTLSDKISADQFLRVGVMQPSSFLKLSSVASVSY